MSTKVWNFYNVCDTLVFSRSATTDVAREIITKHVPVQIEDALDDLMVAAAQANHDIGTLDDLEAYNEATHRLDAICDDVLQTVKKRVKYAIAEDGSRIDA